MYGVWVPCLEDCNLALHRRERGPGPTSPGEPPCGWLPDVQKWAAAATFWGFSVPSWHFRGCELPQGRLLVWFPWMHPADQAGSFSVLV